MKIFISHSWHDKPLVFDLIDAVRRLAPSANLWIDSDVLRPGQEILGAVEEALIDTDLAVVVWTGHAAASDGVAHELQHLLAIGKQVVFCTTADGAKAGLPPGFGRLPKTLDLGDVTAGGVEGDQLDVVATALAQMTAEHLANDPEVGLGDRDLAAKMLRFGSMLAHLAGREQSTEVQSRKQWWVRRLRQDLASLETVASRTTDGLGRQISLLEEVVNEVRRSPTNE